MTDIKVIAFVGMPGSGKGTCTSYLEKTYGLPVVHFGNMLYEEMQNRGLDNVKDESWFRVKIREEEGLAVLAKFAARKAKELLASGKKMVVLDGLYSWSEYKYLQKEFGASLVLVAIAAPRKLRYERVLNRQDYHRKYSSPGQIWAREVQEIEDIEKGGPIAFADYTIVNDGSQDELLQKLEKTLQELGLSTN